MIKIQGSNLSDEIVKEIGKFTILWAEFEKEYCNNNCNDSLLVANKDSFIVDEDIIAKFNTNLHGRVEDFNEDIETYTNYNLIPNNAHRPKDEYIKIMRDFINLDELVKSDWICGALLCIHRIRNNLLHGLKILSELNYQVELFKSMNKVLENIRRKSK